jgi:hypothetical protein
MQYIADNLFSFIRRYVLGVLLISLLSHSLVRAGEYLVNVTQFGAVADAKFSDGKWTGTDNAAAFNKCAAYCRAGGNTMLVPKGDYGVASTVWLTNPAKDRIDQASLTIIGSNRSPFGGQPYGARICVLNSFSPGKIIDVKKKDGSVVKEPDLVPVLAVSNGRQVHIEGLTVQGADRKALMCGIAIGNVSQITSVRNCSINNTYAGIVVAGIRPSKTEGIIEGGNDLLLVEQCHLRNVYNIVCAGTQPNACEYRNSSFGCTRSVFTGTLITNTFGDSRGQHKFSSSLFATLADSPEEETVYFDLATNDLVIDSCEFESGQVRTLPEVLIRQCPNGGVSYQYNVLTFTNNVVYLNSQYRFPHKSIPLIDTMTGNRAIIQGNCFTFGTAIRLKCNGMIFIGNVFRLVGPYDLQVINDTQELAGTAGDVKRGFYDFNHFIKNDANVMLMLPDKNPLKQGEDYTVKVKENAFEITEAGKKKMDIAKTTKILASYRANDAGHIQFEAWGANTFNPPQGWQSQNLTMIANKVVGKTDSGQTYETELSSKYASAR